MADNQPSESWGGYNLSFWHTLSKPFAQFLGCWGVLEDQSALQKLV